MALAEVGHRVEPCPRRNVIPMYYRGNSNGASMIGPPLLKFILYDGKSNTVHSGLSNIFNLILQSDTVVLAGRNYVLVAGKEVTNSKTNILIMIGTDNPF